MLRSDRGAAAALLVWVFAACSSSSKNEASPCQVGNLQLCGCPDGSQGQRSCGSDGAFGACQCGDAGLGGTGGTSGASGSAGSAGSATGGTTSTTCDSDAGTAPGPSCDGLPDCPSGLSCCDTVCLAGGTFIRDNNPAAPATLSPFRLDRFEVTVGRFRNFVAAGANALPATGTGKHLHVGLGNGITDESGWLAGWAQYVPINKSDWDNQLSACGQDGATTKFPTWTTTSGANEDRPINCVSWYQAYAFCIWDGGFLPTEAELGFAYVNGGSQHPYPWGDTAPTPVDAVFDVADGPLAVGSKKISLSGFYDLAGNVYEFALDSYVNENYPELPCVDCVVQDAKVQDRVIRGGGWKSAVDTLAANARQYFTFGGQNVGFRCARSP